MDIITEEAQSGRMMREGATVGWLPDDDSGRGNNGRENGSIASEQLLF